MEAVASQELEGTYRTPMESYLGLVTPAAPPAATTIQQHGQLRFDMPFHPEHMLTFALLSGSAGALLDEKRRSSDVSDKWDIVGRGILNLSKYEMKAEKKPRGENAFGPRECVKFKENPDGTLVYNKISLTFNALTEGEVVIRLKYEPLPDCQSKGAASLDARRQYDVYVNVVSEEATISDVTLRQRPQTTAMTAG